MSASDSARFTLPANPSLRHLKLQAKELLAQARTGDPSALSRVQPYQERKASGESRPLSLALAQLTIAREYGFASWTELKIHVENAAQSFAEKLEVLLAEGWSWGDQRRAKTALESEPALATANIYVASVCQHVATIEENLAKDPAIATTPGGPRNWVPLLYATWSCFLNERQDAAIEVIRRLLDAGADPNATWHNPQYNVDESALYGCVDANCERAAKVLLEAGANPNDNESLYHACEKKNIALLRVLGEHGLNPNDISYCIKHAMDYRWDEGIAWFLEQGADPNAVHPSANETSLHWAIKRNCSLQTIQSLLAAGADPNAPTKANLSAFLGIRGWTPYDFALRLGRKDVAQVLKEHGARKSELSDVDRYVIACANGNALEADRLLAQYPDLPRQINHHDRTLIAHVAQVCSWDGVRLMVQHGWSPEQDGGWINATPLTWACCYGAADTVEFLLAAGASPIKDVGGYFSTPLHTTLYCRWAPGDHRRILETLLNHNVPIPDQLNASGQAELDELVAEYRQRKI